MLRYVCISIPARPLQALLRQSAHQPPLAPTAVPMAVIEAADPVWLVIALNPAARADGVEPGMTSVQAQARSPQIVLRERSIQAEVELDSRLMDEAERTSPRVEVVSSNALVLDLRGLERLKGSAETIARDLLARLESEGVHAHAGLAARPPAAVLAAAALDHSGATASSMFRAGDNTSVCACSSPIFAVSEGEESATLAPLPVQLLLAFADVLEREPSTKCKAAVNAAVSLDEIFASWGIRTIGEFANLPRVGIAERLGQAGLRLWARARGEHDALLNPRAAGSSELVASMEFDPPLAKLEVLHEAITTRLESVCAEVRERDRVLERVLLAVTVAPENGSVHTVEYKRRFLAPTTDASAIATQLMLAIEQRPLKAAVSSFRLLCRATRPRRIQQQLFGQGAPDAEKIGKVLARVAELLDDPEYSRIGSPRLLDSHRPDAFEVMRFASPRASDSNAERSAAPINVDNAVDPTRPLPVQPAATSPVQTIGATLALRRFRPAVAIDVHVTDTVPVEVIVSPRARFRVIRAAGPWRASGDWWNERAWSRDEWDVELASGGVCRVFRDHRDGRWYLDGRYD